LLALVAAFGLMHPGLGRRVRLRLLIPHPHLHTLDLERPD
jgi:hypothetical protein